MSVRRIAIVGTRAHDPNRADSCPAPVWAVIRNHCWARLIEIRDTHDWSTPLVIVSGGEPTGIDALAEEFARRNRISRVIHEPNYRDPGLKNKRAAPPIRNGLVVTDCTEVEAWPKPSREGGTEDTIRRALKAGKPCVVHEPWRAR